MADELVGVATAVISAMAALTGVGMTWALSNISAEGKDLRLERESARHRLEDKYVQVLADLEMVIRSIVKWDAVNERLSVAGGAICVFAGNEVRSCFTSLTNAMDDFMDLIGDYSQKPLCDYRQEHPLAWNRVVEARLALVDAMRRETLGLRNY